MKGTMTYAIKLLSVEGEIANSDGAVSGYVAYFDPEAHDGQGELQATEDITKALKFTTYPAAFECWRQQSTTRPLREDGRPNRPMTAFTVEIVKAEEVAK